VPVAVPTFYAGQEPTAAQLQQLSDAITGDETIKVKAADQTVSNATSGATLVNDDTLYAAVAASTTYAVKAIIFYAAGTTPDMKITFTWPSGATMPWGLTGYTTALAYQAVAFSAPASGTTFSVGGNGTSNDLLLIIEGTLTVSTTAGTLQFQFAQNTADATTTTVRAGSRLHLTVV